MPQICLGCGPDWLCERYNDMMNRFFRFETDCGSRWAHFGLSLIHTGQLNSEVYYQMSTKIHATEGSGDEVARLGQSPLLPSACKAKSEIYSRSGTECPLISASHEGQSSDCLNSNKTKSPSSAAVQRRTH